MPVGTVKETACNKVLGQRGALYPPADLDPGVSKLALQLFSSHQQNLMHAIPCVP